MGDVTPMRRKATKAKPAEEVEELSLDELDLEDLDLEDADLQEEPEVEAPVKAKKVPAKKPAPKAKPAPKVEEPEEELELDFEEETEEAPKLAEQAKKTRTYTRKTAHDVVTEGTDMTAFLRGFAAGKYGVNLSDEDASRVQATLEAAEQDHTGNLFAYLIGSSTTETASAKVIKSPGVTQVVPKAKPATKTQVKAAAKTAPAKAAPARKTTPAGGKAEVGSMEHKRAWLRKNGYPNLGDRGRLPGEGVAAYEDAHDIA